MPSSVILMPQNPPSWLTLEPSSLDTPYPPHIISPHTLYCTYIHISKLPGPFTYPDIKRRTYIIDSSTAPPSYIYIQDNGYLDTGYLSIDKLDYKFDSIKSKSPYWSPNTIGRGTFSPSDRYANSNINKIHNRKPTSPRLPPSPQIDKRPIYGAYTYGLPKSPLKAEQYHSSQITGPPNVPKAPYLNYILSHAICSLVIWEKDLSCEVKNNPHLVIMKVCNCIIEKE